MYLAIVTTAFVVVSVLYVITKRQLDKANAQLAETNTTVRRLSYMIDSFATPTFSKSGVLQLPSTEELDRLHDLLREQVGIDEEVRLRQKQADPFLADDMFRGYPPAFNVEDRRAPSERDPLAAYIDEPVPFLVPDDQPLPLYWGD